MSELYLSETYTHAWAAEHAAQPGVSLRKVAALWELPPWLIASRINGVICHRRDRLWWYLRWPRHKWNTRHG